MLTYIVRAHYEVKRGVLNAHLPHLTVNDILGLINDRREIMRQIETLLPAALSAGGGPSLDSLISLKPFARVDGVQAGSIAHKNGLLVGDQIIKLNHISGFGSMAEVGKVIDECKRQGRPLRLSLLRGGGTNIVEVTIADLHEPLGCHIVPAFHR